MEKDRTYSQTCIISYRKETSPRDSAIKMRDSISANYKKKYADLRLKIFGKGLAERICINPSSVTEALRSNPRLGEELLKSIEVPKMRVHCPDTNIVTKS